MKENLFNYVPLKIYRYLRWRKGVEKEYRYNRDHFSKEYAGICLSAVNAERSKRPNVEVLAAYAKKDAYVLRYLENLCGDVIDEYKGKEHLTVNCPPPKDVRHRIWVFWWTGEETAPDIVKACIRSIQRNANGHEVVLLDQNNYRNYVTLPDTILKKHEEGKISHAHFSDVLRLTLLSTYGGAWIDATVFISQNIPEDVFSDAFYTLKTESPNVVYYSKSRWCGYFLAGNKDFLLFSFARDLLIAHWERADYLIDYLLMDYVFGIACKYCPEVEKTVNDLPDNNTKRGYLMNTINEPYSKESFESLTNNDTFAFKLSWRYGKPKAQTEKGELSNYGYILSL